MYSQAGLPGTSSTVQMLAGDTGSGNTVSGPGQAGPILHSLELSPLILSQALGLCQQAAGSLGCPLAPQPPLLYSLLPRDLLHPLYHTGSWQAGRGQAGEEGTLTLNHRGENDGLLTGWRQQ